VLARHDYDPIAGRQHLVQVYPDALELLEQALVVRDHRVPTAVDTRLRRVRVGVERDLRVEE
jgi:hypothetical protein